MLGVSGMMGGASDDRAAAEAEATHENGGSSEAGGFSSIPVEESERSGGGGGGNRWPRQETLALLKIRSDMDAAFRDSSLKGPLWEEVSRKMAELGFQRSAKKCREKFENVYKYHKRTKDGRAAKTDGKTYRFFDQLEALENTLANPFGSSLPLPLPLPAAAATMAAPVNSSTASMPAHVTVSSISPTPLSVVPPQTMPMVSSPFQQSQPPLQHLSAARNRSVPPQNHIFHGSHPSLLSDSTSSSTSSDDDIQRRRGKKRKWKESFQRLMKDVIQKQEELQKKFLDTLEKRERDRMAKEEAWRVQEMARMNREHDLLVQERSIAAAKDAAVIAFLQKVTDQHNLQIPISTVNKATPANQAQQPENPSPPPQQENPPPAPQQSTLQTQAAPAAVTVTTSKVFDISKTADNNGDTNSPASFSRWPKTEVQALINLRTSLDLKYHDNGPKGPLWEEISAAMSKLGYSRSAKRCKEKWENINKYFKKVKESNKKRTEDSKTCPYFHQLEAIYKERAKHEASPAFNPGYAAKPENPMIPIMAQPEQQWSIPDTQQQHHHNGSSMQDQDRESDDPNINDEEDDDEDDDDEDVEGMGYEIIANKQQSSVTNAVEES